tara:strand:- start:716 stop:3226 length:2511 start_codon:yes stop_codon:yes gene_type:complete
VEGSGAKFLLEDIAAKAGLTIVAAKSHEFEEEGLTIALLFEKGHLTLHTWPERDYFALDLFLNDALAHEQVVNLLTGAFSARQVISRNRRIGSLDVQSGKTDHGSWFWENTMPGEQSGNVVHSFKIKEMIYQGGSDIQSICVFENPLYGRMLALDGIIQMTDADAFIYNEMLVHSALLSHPKPERILIIGGGTGGALRECLRHQAGKVTLVEIDRKVIDVCQEFFPHVNREALQDPRVEVVIADAKEHIRGYRDEFDVVIVDSSDPVGPSEPLYDESFYRDVHRALKPDGLVTLQVGSLLDPELLSQTNARLRRVFRNVTMLRYSVSSFNCGECCFMVAGKSECAGKVSLETLRRRLADRSFQANLRHYTPEIHLSSQIVPPHVGLCAKKKTTRNDARAHREGVGKHILMEFWGATPPDDLAQIDTLMKDVALCMKATALGDVLVKFNPSGFDAILLLSESHIAMHANRGSGHVALDCFTCGNGEFFGALPILKKRLTPQRFKIEELERGGGSGSGRTTRPPIDHDEGGWFLEHELPGRRCGSIRHSFRIQRKLCEKSSRFQNILIFDNPMYGRTLALDGVIQFTESDEFIYHEMLVHPVLLSHPQPSRVLVLGGGDGGILRECLRHVGVRQVVLAEIDTDVIDACREFFPGVSQGAFDDPRVEVRVGDARALVKEYQESFDVVVVDSSDSIGSDKALHSMEFYSDIHRALKPDGAMTTLMGSFIDQLALRRAYDEVGQTFEHLSLTRVNIPSYNCGEFCFLIATKTEAADTMPLSKLQDRFKARLPNSHLKYYTPAMQLGSHLMPPHLEAAFDGLVVSGGPSPPGAISERGVVDD